MLAAKAKALAAAGAQVTAAQRRPAEQSAEAKADVPNGGHGSSTAPAEFAFPLRVSQRTTLEADLRHSGWTDALEAAGWDRKVCTLPVQCCLLVYVAKQQ